MSPTSTTNITVTANSSHWYDILEKILLTIGQFTPLAAQFIPAPIEDGIKIATSIGPAVIEQIKSGS